MGRRGRVLTGSVLVLAHMSTGCTSWRVAQASPQVFISREHPNAVQVREQGGSKYVVASPRLEGDSLTGYVKRVELRIPLATIDKVAVRRFNVIKTVAVVVVVPVASVAALIGIACAGGGGCSSISGGLGSLARLP